MSRNVVSLWVSSIIAHLHKELNFGLVRVAHLPTADARDLF